MQDFYDYGYIFQDFEIQFPIISRLTVTWRYFMDEVIIVDLDDGTSIFYDFANKSYRTIRGETDVTKMSEEKWKQEFGRRLARKMELKNMTQRRLSELTGVSHIMIGRYLNGTSIPSLFMATKIATILGCSVSDLSRME